MAATRCDPFNYNFKQNWFRFRFMTSSFISAETQSIIIDLENHSDEPRCSGTYICCNLLLNWSLTGYLCTWNSVPFHNRPNSHFFSRRKVLAMQGINFRQFKVEIICKRSISASAITIEHINNNNWLRCGGQVATIRKTSTDDILAEFHEMQLLWTYRQLEHIFETRFRWFASLRSNQN